ncbi:MAG: hypothetical protein HQM16_10285 [Deltaproteobacteria bacterium]|nr:hypothetical protein [Deltaproteobacteria bacterium]
MLKKRHIILLILLLCRLPAVAQNSSNTYVSSKFGIRFLYPKKHFLEDKKCREKQRDILIKIFEADNTIYLAPEKEMDSNNPDAINHCIVEPVTLKQVSHRQTTAWKITMYNEITEENILSISNKHFQHKCETYHKTITVDQNHYDIELISRDADVSKRYACVKDHQYYLKYSPKSRRLAILEGGQDCILRSMPDSNNVTCVDDKKLIDSFRFID